MSRCTGDDEDAKSLNASKESPKGSISRLERSTLFTEFVEAMEDTEVFRGLSYRAEKASEGPSLSRPLNSAVPAENRGCAEERENRVEAEKGGWTTSVGVALRKSEKSSSSGFWGR